MPTPDGPQFNYGPRPESKEPDYKRDKPEPYTGPEKWKGSDPSIDTTNPHHPDDMHPDHPSYHRPTHEEMKKYGPHIGDNPNFITVYGNPGHLRRTPSSGGPVTWT
jgi:hypothetical protein